MRGGAGMKIGENEGKIEISINSLIELASKLEDVSNAAWTAAQSLKMIATAGTKIEEARELMFSPPKVKIEPSRELQESLDAWLGDDY